jgi:anti-anti-sigma regulatory factor
MMTNPTCIRVDPARLHHVLRQEALDALTRTGGLVLDFSSVPRIDVGALKELDELARRAGEKSVKIALSAVNPDVYKVLKLARLSSRFSFLP